MTWFKIDDQLAFHPKTIRAGNNAMGLWVRAGSWCAAHLQEGRVPAEIVATLGGKPGDVRRLVEAGFWELKGGDYVFRDWHDYNPTKEAEMERRRSSRARQTVARDPALRDTVRQRDDDRCRYCGAEVQWSNRRGPLGGTYDHVIPNGPSDESNLVVACRGCNSRKGKRTPSQAGMRLRPESDLSPRLETDPVSAFPPTRPDPTRPSTPSGSTSSGDLGGGVSERSAREHEPPSPRCPKHEDEPTTAPCRPCGDARKAHERWTADAGARQAREQRDAAAAAKAAIKTCPRCDEMGWVETPPGLVRCDHREEHAA